MILQSAKPQPHSANLGQLFPELMTSPLADLPVAGLSLDSRNIAAGDLFLACRGEAADGREYVEQAADRGAVAIALDTVPGEEEVATESYGVRTIPSFAVVDLKARLSEIADIFYGSPSQCLVLTGVTGTNGKTTCTQILGQLFRKLYGQGGVIGTLGAGLTAEVREAVNTTPDPLSIQRLLATWLETGVTQVAMEVSSHALHQGRVSALEFDCAIFTNLTRDHLDYHQTMSEYGATKATLFRQPGLKRAILNLDDAYSAALRSSLGADVSCFTYSCWNQKADIYALNTTFHVGGLSSTLVTPWGRGELELPLLGEFNLSNALAALTCLCAGGATFGAVIAALQECMPVPGRMETLVRDGAPLVIIDYAHTPDALDHVLSAARYHTKGNLWCIVGCGGDRDRGKRPEMGAVASAGADIIVVTSDNPRTENPQAIINDILEGCVGDTRVEPNRERAIATAIAQAEAGDTVVVAGKGHENYQQIGSERLPFSDVEHAKLALSQGGLL